MENIKINIRGINYDVDLDKLNSQVNFSIMKGRRFILEGINEKGESKNHRIKLNDIFDAILKTHPEVDPARLNHAYENLKTAGYEMPNSTTKIVSLVHRKFKSSEREGIDQMMFAKADFKEKIMKAPDFPDLTVETLEKSLNKLTCKNTHPKLGEVQVGSGRYLLRPGKESYSKDKGFTPLPKAMQKANYVVNLMEGGNDDNPFKNGIPRRNAKVVNFTTWKDETPPGLDIINLAKDVVAHCNFDKPDMVFCRQGLQRTSTFVAIVELVRNEGCWEQDNSNDTARKVIVTVLQEMAIQDNGRIPTKSQLTTLLSDEFINAVRSRTPTLSSEKVTKAIPKKIPEELEQKALDAIINEINKKENTTSKAPIAAISQFLSTLEKFTVETGMKTSSWENEVRDAVNITPEIRKNIAILLAAEALRSTDGIEAAKTWVRNQFIDKKNPGFAVIRDSDGKIIVNEAWDLLNNLR